VSLIIYIKHAILLFGLIFSHWCLIYLDVCVISPNDWSNFQTSQWWVWRSTRQIFWRKYLPLRARCRHCEQECAFVFGINMGTIRIIQSRQKKMHLQDNEPDLQSVDPLLSLTCTHMNTKAASFKKSLKMQQQKY